MNESVSIILVALLLLVLLVLCAIWHHVTAMRYYRVQKEKGRQYKWYQLFGKLNEIGFWVKFIAIILFGLTIFISLHYLCTTYPHYLKKTPDFDYMSVICTFFGILVTLLIGWNIYTALDFKKKVEKLEEDQDFIGDCLLQSKKEAKTIKAYTLRLLSLTWAANTFVYTQDKKLTMTIVTAINSIYLFLVNDDVKTANDTLNATLDFINQAKAKNIELTPLQKKQLQREFKRINGNDKLIRLDELYDYIA